MLKFKILFQLTGSISCFKAAQVISALVQNGHEVKCVATQNALRFIGEATLEGLTGSSVFKDSYENGQMMDHIHLARWADIFVLCPATANTINKLAQGLADDVIGQIFLAKGNEKPYFVFPAMNHEMYSHPATQSAIKRLSEWNVTVFETGKGHQACGENGLGRLLEPHEIMSRIERPSQGQKILITAGGNREPIDEIRFISNTSTGRTAARLADEFIGAGHQVTYLAGEGAQTPHSKAKIQTFSDFKSLSNLMERELKNGKYDLVIHAAAVSDYSVGKMMSRGKALTASSKLDSDIPELTLALKRNKKIVSEIKKWSPKTCLVAFKLTNKASESEVREAIEKLSTQSKSDLIVHNDFSQMKESDNRIFEIFSKVGKKTQSTKTKSLKELAKLLIERSSPHDFGP